jgi:hypothetical protein
LRTTEINIRPVVQSGPANRPVVDAEARRPDNVKRQSVGGAEARNIAGVRMDFRFDQSNVKHVHGNFDA